MCIEKWVEKEEKSEKKIHNDYYIETEIKS